MFRCSHYADVRLSQKFVNSDLVIHRGLSTILSSGNMTTYPVLCAKVKARFSVLSDTINAVCSLLTDEHKRNDISEVVSHLQKYEGEKLNLTAAIHLEKLLMRNEDIGLSSGGSKEGIQSLERKFASDIDSINDIIDIRSLTIRQKITSCTIFKTRRRQ